MIFNASNWYWQVGGDATRVYSSASNCYVGKTDEAYLAWVQSGGVAAKIDSEASIWQYVSGILPSWLFDGATFARPTASTYSRAQLKAYAAAARYEKEVGGLTINGMPVATDRQSQAMTNGAYSMALHDASFTTKWKGGDGSFTQLDAQTIIALATAIGNHVANCFDVEADVAARIDAGTLISLPEINAAFASIT